MQNSLPIGALLGRLDASAPSAARAEESDVSVVQPGMDFVALLLAMNNPVTDDPDIVASSALERNADGQQAVARNADAKQLPFSQVPLLVNHSPIAAPLARYEVGDSNQYPDTTKNSSAIATAVTHAPFAVSTDLAKSTDVQADTSAHPNPVPSATPAPDTRHAVHSPAISDRAGDVPVAMSAPRPVAATFNLSLLPAKIDAPAHTAVASPPVMPITTAMPTQVLQRETAPGLTRLANRPEQNSPAMVENLRKPKSLDERVQRKAAPDAAAPRAYEKSQIADLVPPHISAADDLSRIALLAPSGLRPHSSGATGVSPPGVAPASAHFDVTPASDSALRHSYRQATAPTQTSPAQAQIAVKASEPTPTAVMNQPTPSQNSPASPSVTAKTAAGEQPVMPLTASVTPVAPTQGASRGQEASHAAIRPAISQGSPISAPAFRSVQTTVDITTPEPLFQHDTIPLNDIAQRIEPVASTARIDAAQRPELSRHIGQQLAQIAAQAPDRPVEIALSPEELGRVRLGFTATDHSITVSVVTERGETLDLLRRNIDTLAREFRDIGYTDITFEFGHGQQPGNGGDTPDQVPPIASEIGEDLTMPAQPVRLDLGAADGLDLRL